MHQPSDDAESTQCVKTTGVNKKKRRSRGKKTLDVMSQQQLQPQNQEKEQSPKQGSRQHQRQLAESAGKENQPRLPNHKKNKNRRGKSRVTPNEETRWFGRFRCELCKKQWDSAHVYTNFLMEIPFCRDQDGRGDCDDEISTFFSVDPRTGQVYSERGPVVDPSTRANCMVKYKQRCKNCGEASWRFPYQIQEITCGLCGYRPCECLCEDCELLLRKRYVLVPDKRPGSENKLRRFLDQRLEYCNCEKKRPEADTLGSKNDPNKPHIEELCQRCRTGRFCAGKTVG